MFSGPLAEPRLQRVHVQRRSETKVQVRLHVLEIGRPRGPTCAVRRERLGRHAQLLRHGLDRSRWRRVVRSSGANPQYRRAQSWRATPRRVWASLCCRLMAC